MQCTKQNQKIRVLIQTCMHAENTRSSWMKLILGYAECIATHLILLPHHTIENSAPNTKRCEMSRSIQQYEFLQTTCVISPIFLPPDSRILQSAGTLTEDCGLRMHPSEKDFKFALVLSLKQKGCGSSERQ